MRRRKFITLIGSAGLTSLWFPVARAQEAGRIYRLGVMTGAARQASRMVGFFDELKVFGFVEGQNLLFSFNRGIVIERAAALKLPAIYECPEMAEEGGLLGYGARLHLIYRQLGRLLVKILRGAKPEDLPVEQPTNFELVINLTTAEALGLTIPESFLMRADKVIE
jgi:ABC-type uncharacterized transport system substrate-binding protein